MDKVAARANSVSVGNPYKTEKSLVEKKLKPLISDFKSKAFFFTGKKLSEEEVKVTFSKWISILKSLSSEEIKMLKWKLNGLALKLIHYYAPPQIRNSPEIMGLIKSGLNLMEAIQDEKLTQESINLLARVWEAMRSSPDFKKALYNPIIFFQRDPGLEGEVKNLLINYTKHLNKLAQTGADSPSLPSSQKEIWFQKLAGELSTHNPNPGTPGEISWSNSLIKQGFDKSLSNLNSGTGQKEFNLNNLLNDLKDLTTVQTKPKWYQNPWIVGSLIFGAAVVGGLIVWLFLRKNKEERD